MAGEMRERAFRRKERESQERAGATDPRVGKVCPRGIQEDGDPQETPEW